VRQKTTGTIRRVPAKPAAALWAALLAGLAIASGGAWGGARAQGTLVDRVVAVVEDDGIFQSDVDQGVKQILFQRGASSISVAERNDLEKQVLDELIKNKLVLAKANRLGISVSFAEVEKAVDRAIEENKKVMGSEQAFTRQLEAEGLTLESLKKLYREQIHNRMLVERVIAREIDRSSVSVSEDELKKAYDERKSGLPQRPSVVHLATIFVGVESSVPAREKAKATIDEVYKRVLAGEDFAKLAKEYSEDPSAEAGGNLGKLKLSDLGNRAFAEAAAKLAVGEVSEPVLTPFGYHVINVTAADTTKDEVEIRHILVRVKTESQDVEQVYQSAQDVHRQLDEGAPFDSMAVRYSTDAASASSGGDLGWLRVSDLPEFFQDVLRDMKAGDYSPVLREPSGFRIVKLLEREEARPYTFEEVREELSKALEEDKLEGLYDGYVTKLKDEFYVEERPLQQP
jgi:peptidyl-prolyl cis-trans isomerase SurA